MRRLIVVVFVAALFAPSVAAAFIAKSVGTDESLVLVAEKKKKAKKAKPKPKAEEKVKAAPSSAPSGYKP
jgi:hypothetical protein